MPMIEVTATEKIGQNAALKMKRALGENITIFPGKVESRVMVVLKGDATIFFGGKEGPAALVSIALFKAQPEETYDKFAKVAIDAIVDALPVIPRDRIYVKYQTLDHKAWGKEL